MKGFSFTQLITEPTRITETRESLLDHIYIISPDRVKSHHVPKLGMCFPTRMVYNLQGFSIKKGHHTSVRYRCQNTLNQTLLLKTWKYSHGLSLIFMMNQMMHSTCGLTWLRVLLISISHGKRNGSSMIDNHNGWLMIYYRL